MYKRFIAIFFSILLFLLLFFAGVMFVVDPYYQYHKPWGDMPLRLEDGRYQNAGASRNLDYDSVLLGTSVSANFSAAEFNELWGIQIHKIIVLGGFFSEFAAALDIAVQTHEINHVFWGIDSNILKQRESENTTELPHYLYNDNPFDDIHYLLNKGVFFRDTIKNLKMFLKGEPGDWENGGFTWGDDVAWSKESAIASYSRQEVTSPELEVGAFLPAAEANLDLILSYVKAQKDMKFTFYLVPYSILYWDDVIRRGELDATLEMQRFILESLTEYPNVEIFYFMDDTELITNLDFYGDHIHYSPEINSYLAEEMATGEPIKRAEIPERMQRLKQFVSTYDYEGLFEKEKISP